jgi:hypothetical protein
MGPSGVNAGDASCLDDIQSAHYFYDWNFTSFNTYLGHYLRNAESTILNADHSFHLSMYFSFQLVQFLSYHRKAVFECD